ncbi:hypothetical protein AAW00_13180 [Aurantiacibacter luteus]|uniref:2-keto-4-pentenoate hydratase n=1 Tax=Aurantiacibacter luteus TaxID=1581420 RepID=A0A0G9MP43_9SPHN|nr:hypothetical protein AAW00_13180 [Aurantiacibacter luteus]
MVRARAAGRALPGPPSGLPSTLADAYRLQDHSIARWDDRVAGWKVGGVPADYLDRFAERYLAGPIFEMTVRRADAAAPVAMPVFAEGFAAIEPEFVFRLGTRPEEDRMFIGAEIASSPIPDINAYGPVAVISDFGNNNGLLVGPEVIDWRTRARPVHVRAVIDGELAGEREVEDFPRDALASLAFLRRLADERGHALPSGTFVSSGAITGVHEAGVGAGAVLDFGDLGSVALELVGMTG